MMEFPSSTYVNKVIPKKAFYAHLPMQNGLRGKFISDVERLVVTNSLTKRSLNLDKESDIKEILVLRVELRQKAYDKAILEAIARQNHHKLVFAMLYKDECQLAIYQGRLYGTDWQVAEQMELQLTGQTIREMWNGIISQIAISEASILDMPRMSGEEMLDLQARIAKLKKQIDRAQRAMNREKQPRRKYELFNQIKTYQKELEEIENG